MRDVLFPLRVLHRKLHEWSTIVLPAYLDRICNKEAVYLVLTPQHGNLGDHAIALAEIETLRKCGIPYIEVTGDQLRVWSRKKILSVMNGRPIFINGGGNIGTLWPEVQTLMEEIVSANPLSSILIFPNSAFFEKDSAGKLALEKASEVFNQHGRLRIFVRETISYQFLIKSFHHVELVPDMTFLLNKSKSGMERKGCILCLRSDRERTRSAETQRIIEEQARNLFNKHIRSLDMVAEHSIPIADREAELEKQYDSFRHAELVITDRLHGMVFCAITGTPCIVIDSKSPKVRGCYEWIKDLPYIRFCNDVSKIDETFRAIPSREWTYDNSKLLPLYDPLIHEILTVTKRK